MWVGGGGWRLDADEAAAAVARTPRTRPPPGAAADHPRGRAGRARPRHLHFIGPGRSRTTARRRTARSVRAGGGDAAGAVDGVLQPIRSVPGLRPRRVRDGRRIRRAPRRRDPASPASRRRRCRWHRRPARLGDLLDGSAARRCRRGSGRPKTVSPSHHRDAVACAVPVIAVTAAPKGTRRRRRDVGPLDHRGHLGETARTEGRGAPSMTVTGTPLAAQTPRIRAR